MLLWLILKNENEDEDGDDDHDGDDDNNDGDYGDLTGGPASVADLEE